MIEWLANQTGGVIAKTHEGATFLSYSPRNVDPTPVALQTATLTILTCKMPHYPQLKLVNPNDKIKSNYILSILQL